MPDSPTPPHAQGGKQPPRRRRPGQKLTPQERKDAQARFLLSFARVGVVKTACGEAGIHRDTLYQWLEHDEPFSVRYHQAEKDAGDVLYAEAFRRAVEGTQKAVVSMGRVVSVDGAPLVEREYSDMLLINLLRARDPRFRQKSQVELTGADGGPMQTQTTLDLAAVQAALQAAFADDPEGRYAAAAALAQLAHGANSAPKPA